MLRDATRGREPSRKDTGTVCGPRQARRHRTCGAAQVSGGTRGQVSSWSSRATNEVPVGLQERPGALPGIPPRDASQSYAMLRHQHSVGHHLSHCEAEAIAARACARRSHRRGVARLGRTSPGVPEARIVAHMPLDAPSAAAGLSHHEGTQAPSSRRSTYPGPSLPMAR